MRQWHPGFPPPAGIVPGQVGGLEPAGVVFVLGPALLVRGFCARSPGCPEINLQFLRQPGHDFFDERAFVHASFSSICTNSSRHHSPGALARWNRCSQLVADMSLNSHRTGPASVAGPRYSSQPIAAVQKNGAAHGLPDCVAHARSVCVHFLSRAPNKLPVASQKRNARQPFGLFRVRLGASRIYNRRFLEINHLSEIVESWPLPPAFHAMPLKGRYGTGAAPTATENSFATRLE